MLMIRDTSFLFCVVLALGLTGCSNDSTYEKSSANEDGATSTPAPVPSETPLVVGACCLESSCAALFPDDCASMSGVWVGGVCGMAGCAATIPDPGTGTDFCEESDGEGFCEEEEEEGTACCLADTQMCAYLLADVCDAQGGTTHDAECEEACPTFEEVEEQECEGEECEEECEGEECEEECEGEECEEECEGEECEEECEGEECEEECEGEECEEECEDEECEEGPLTACCWVEDEACELLPEVVCREEEGTSHTGQQCAEACPSFEVFEEGACCLPDEGVCEFVWSEVCTFYGGNFAAGQECEAACPEQEDRTDLLEPCCFVEEDEAYCEEAPARVCMFEGGQIHDSCNNPCGM